MTQYGIPNGWKLVKIGIPKEGEYFLNCKGNPVKAGQEYDWFSPIIERVEPQYRPFISAEEFLPYRDKWVYRIKEPNHYMKIVSYDNTGISTVHTSLTYGHLFEFFKFDDECRCGIEL